MLRVVVHGSAAAALKYYTEGLSREDYYSEGQEIIGKWFGRAGKRLGLVGDVGREQFAALVENVNPVTGQRLTARQKEGRRVGYDFNFHAPKSLSVLYGLTRDPRILEIFRKAVSETMLELETRAETRVRRGGENSNRTTGNLVWAEFIHFTARPVGGIPDPHLHAHCFTFNCSYDQEERKWKAAELAAIKENAPYFEAAFHSRLTGALVAEGYGIQRKKASWEIKGVPASVVEKFSRRTAQIDDLAHELGITDPKVKDTLGGTSRENKRHGMTFSDLQAAWNVRITQDEHAQIAKVFAEKGRTTQPRMLAAEALDYAFAKMFERRSVVERDRLLAEALRHGAGSVSVDGVKAEFERRGVIGRKIDGQHYCTTRDVLAEELELIHAVRSGRNSMAPFFTKKRMPQLSGKLSAEQRAAAEVLLTSKDQVTALRGIAGAGKTTLMKEVVAAIESTGRPVLAFAPSAGASRGTLRDEGFAGAETVARLLVDPRMQHRARNAVIWIDEAGLLGVRDLAQIMKIAGPSTPVIVSGDTGQHAPVTRGDGLRLLQLHAGLKIATLSEIRRQKDLDYRKAVESLSKGNIKDAFRRLGELGAFVEIANPFERYRALAADYIQLQKASKGEPPLVVCPAHGEGAEATYAIREARRESGELGRANMYLQYHNLRWEDAEKGLVENYRREGLMVQFHLPSKGIGRAERFRVVGVDEHSAVEIEGPGGKRSTLPLKEAAKFQVYEEREIELAVSDRVRITRNGQSENGKRLNNGDILTIEKFSRDGGLVLSNKAVLGKDHGHLAHGYTVTSYASQSKTKRDVLVGQSEKSFVASSKEQIYVSSSRGTDILRFYTDNLAGLQAAVGNSSARMSGMELAGIDASDLYNGMSAEMNAKQWADALVKKRGIGEGKPWAERAAHHRKIDPAKLEQGLEWKGYIEMRRGMVGPDGKSRSKGFPTSKQRGGDVKKGKTLLKKSEHAESTKKQMQASAPKQEVAEESEKTAAKPAEKKTRLGKAVSASVTNFKKITERVKERVNTGAQKAKEMGQAGARKIRMGKTEFPAKPQGSEKQVEGHRKREKMIAAVRERHVQKSKAPKVAPQPPGPKK